MKEIVINEIGKKIKKASPVETGWIKKDDEIVSRLQAMGVNMYKQQLSKIFSNPFYCGLVSHGLLEGKIVEGIQEKMISKEEFLKIHEITLTTPQYGVSHQKENNAIPLKVFVKCDECKQPFTGYLVKKKNLYYYKCRTTGCRCNKSAKQMHELFTEYLSLQCKT